MEFYFSFDNVWLVLGSREKKTRMGLFLSEAEGKNRG